HLKHLSPILLPYTTLFRSAPRIPFAHYLLGVLRLDTGNAAGAVPELEVAQKAFPNESRVYFSLGNAYARVGRKAEAAKARAEFRSEEHTSELQSRSDLVCR